MKLLKLNRLLLKLLVPLLQVCFETPNRRFLCRSTLSVFHGNLRPQLLLLLNELLISLFGSCPLSLEFSLDLVALGLDLLDISRSQDLATDLGIRALLPRGLRAGNLRFVPHRLLQDFLVLRLKELVFGPTACKVLCQFATLMLGVMQLVCDSIILKLEPLALSSKLLDLRVERARLLLFQSVDLFIAIVKFEGQLLILPPLGLKLSHGMLYLLLHALPVHERQD